MEIGPYRLVPNGDGKLVEAEGAWNEYTNVIFSACRRLSLTGDVGSLCPCSRPACRDGLLVHVDE